MKKLLTLTLLTACLLLTGCGDSSANSLDMAGAAKALENEIENLATISDSELVSVYELDLDKLDEYVIESSNQRTGELFIFAKVTSETKQDAKDMFENMFNILISQSSLYSPDAVKLLENRLETSIGDYLVYIVGNDTKALYNVVQDYIK